MLSLSDKKKKILALLLKSSMYVFAVFGLLFILLLVALFGFLKQDNYIAEPVPSSAILKVDLDEVYAEISDVDLVSEMAGVQAMSFYDLLKTIYSAASDNRVKAILINISESSLGLAQKQEISDAIVVFKSTGKKVYVFSSGFGSLGGGLDEYAAVSGADKIYVQPMSELGITGIGIEVPFFGGLLDKIGVKPEFYTRHEYKNAVASLTDKGFSKIYKAEMSKLGKDIFDNLVGVAAANRKMLVKDFVKAVNNAPIESAEAVKLKLVDEEIFLQDLQARLRSEYRANLVSAFDYCWNLQDNTDRKLPVIGVLVLEGVITSGESINNPITGDAIIGSQTVVSQLEALSKEKNLKALVVRVNSPGGSYGASADIWNAILKIKKDKNIPIIVSQADYAASGGYFVSIAGDYIFAEPSTITGSIGVLGGKFVLENLWKKLSINWGEIKFGDNAAILSANHKFSDKERAAFNRSLDNVYKDFTLKVANARGIDLKTLDKFARGRVWTGSEAVKIGLVDEIGGFNYALLVAKEKAGLKVEDKIVIGMYPKKKNLQEKLKDLIGGQKRTSAQVMLREIGLDLKDLNMLKRMQYDAIMAPMEIRH